MTLDQLKSYLTSAYAVGATGDRKAMLDGLACADLFCRMHDYAYTAAGGTVYDLHFIDDLSMAGLSLENKTFIFNKLEAVKAWFDRLPE